MRRRVVRVFWHGCALFGAFTAAGLSYLFIALHTIPERKKRQR